MVAEETEGRVYWSETERAASELVECLVERSGVKKALLSGKMETPRYGAMAEIAVVTHNRLLQSLLGTCKFSLSFEWE